ncbi:MAG: glutathione S-transferase family protein [Candidatus Sericytochromatia bacterium]|nr:glutathione S-transferase family protein [Candidatus Sericytochromatia bacterium]
MYTLYYHPYSQHARRVISLLEEAGLDYHLKKVQMDKGEHHSDAFLALNPNHQIPVLLDGDLVLTESNAILRYLANKHQLNQWYPDTPVERAQVDQWLDWNQCRLATPVVQIVMNQVFLGEKGDLAAIEKGLQALPELWAILARHLDGRAYLTGAEPRLADLSIASNLVQLGLAQIVPESPVIQEWYQRVLTLKGVQKSLPQALVA